MGSSLDEFLLCYLPLLFVLLRFYLLISSSIDLAVRDWEFSYLELSLLPLGLIDDDRRSSFSEAMVVMKSL
jgi:hypothetical protein